MKGRKVPYKGSYLSKGSNPKTVKGKTKTTQRGHANQACPAQLVRYESCKPPATNATHNFRATDTHAKHSAHPATNTKPEPANTTHTHTHQTNATSKHTNSDGWDTNGQP